MSPPPKPDPTDFSDTATLHATTTSSSSYLPRPPHLTPYIPTHNTIAILRHPSTSTVLTLSSTTSAVHLLPFNPTAAIYWDVIETAGWLAFRNRTSGKFLSHGKWDATIVCEGKSVVGDDAFTHFTATHVGVRGEEGEGERNGAGRYVLQMLDDWILRPLVVVGGSKVARSGGKVGEGAVWEFVVGG